MQATAALRRAGCQAPIVMLTTFDDERYVVQALQHGANGYLLKDLPAAELAEAVRLARAGVAPFDGGVATRLASALRLPPPPAAAPAVLTARELEVLRRLARGATNREIAAEL